MLIFHYYYLLCLYIIEVYLETLDCFYFKMLFFCHIKKIKMFKDELGFF